MLVRLLFILIIKAFSLFLAAQEISFRQFNMEDGLPSEVIYDVTTDNDGFIWLATNNGVVRFNGFEFKSYSINEGLGEIENFLFKKDANGQIWTIGFGSKLSIIKNGKIKPFVYNEVIQNHINQSTRPLDLYIDKTGIVYYSTVGSGAIIININSGTVQYLETKNQKMILINDSTLFNLVPSRIKWKKFSDKNPVKLKVCFRQDTIYTNVNRSGHGRSSILFHDTWYITIDKSKLYQVSNGRLNKVIEFEKDIIFLKEVNDNLFVGTKSGLFVYKNELGQLVEIKFHSLFSSIVATSVASDFEGNLWISTLNSGLFFFPLPFVKKISNFSGISSDIITSMTIFNNMLFFGCQDGSLYKIRNEEIIPLSIGQSSTADGVRSLDVINDTLFISMTASNVFYISKNGNFGKLFVNNVNFSIKKVIDVGGRQLFIGGTIKKREGITLSKNLSVNSELLRPISCAKLNDQHLLIGTLTGIVEHSLEKDSSYYPKSFENVRGKHISALKNFSDSVIAVGVRGEGLYLFGRNKVWMISSNEKLIGNNIYCISEFLNYLLIISEKGIAALKYDVKAKKYQIVPLDFFSYLQRAVVKNIQYFENHLYFGTNQGLIILDSLAMHFSFSNPKVFISAKSIMSDEILKQNQIIDYSGNSIQFFFEGISYYSQSKPSFKYKLSGFENVWKFQSENSVVYSNLKEGDYKMEVSCVDSYGNQSDSLAILSFTILPPFYRTFWFLFLLISFTGSLGYFLFKWRLSILYRRKYSAEIEEKEKAQLELQALRAQMNPHFLFNTLNSIQFYIGNKSPQIGQSYLAKFSKLMRRILDFSTKSQVPLEDEISSLNLYLELEQLRFEGKLDISLDYEGIDLDENIYIPTMLIQPFIENAIIHGLQKGTKDGKILVKFEVIDDELYCFVEDNGVGRKESENIKKESGHKSVGMFVSRRRIEVLNQKSMEGGNIKVIDLTDSAGKAIGTKVSICFGKISKLHEL